MPDKRDQNDSLSGMQDLCNADGLAVLDASGMVCYHNAEWHQPSVAEKRSSHVGLNYRTLLEAACGESTFCVNRLAAAVRQVLLGNQEYFEHHCPNEQHDSSHVIVQVHAYPVRGERGVMIHRQCCRERA
jgi:hypothetical protein